MHGAVPHDDDICLLNDRIPFNDVRTRTNGCQPDLVRNAKQNSKRGGTQDRHELRRRSKSTTLS
jgi:hypothetical protein